MASGDVLRCRTNLSDKLIDDSWLILPFKQEIDVIASSTEGIYIPSQGFKSLSVYVKKDSGTEREKITDAHRSLEVHFCHCRIPNQVGPHSIMLSVNVPNHWKPRQFLAILDYYTQEHSRLLFHTERGVFEDFSQFYSMEAEDLNVILAANHSFDWIGTRGDFAVIE